MGRLSGTSITLIAVALLLSGVALYCYHVFSTSPIIEVEVEIRGVKGDTVQSYTYVNDKLIVIDINGRTYGFDYPSKHYLRPPEIELACAITTPLTMIIWVLAILSVKGDVETSRRR